MTRTITVAGIQTSYGEDMQANIAKTIDFVREAAGKGDELFGFERVARIVGDAGIEGSNAEQIIDSLFSELDAFSDGYEQDDDQTIVVVRAA